MGSRTKWSDSVIVKSLCCPNSEIPSLAWSMPLPSRTPTLDKILAAPSPSLTVLSGETRVHRTRRLHRVGTQPTMKRDEQGVFHRGSIRGDIG